jgi:hypothetical protein
MYSLPPPKCTVLQPASTLTFSNMYSLLSSKHTVQQPASNLANSTRACYHTPTLANRRQPNYPNTILPYHEPWLSYPFLGIPYTAWLSCPYPCIAYAAWLSCPYPRIPYTAWISYPHRSILYTGWLSYLYLSRPYLIPILAYQQQPYYPTHILAFHTQQDYPTILVVILTLLVGEGWTLITRTYQIGDECRNNKMLKGHIVTVVNCHCGRNVQWTFRVGLKSECHMVGLWVV